MAIEKTIKLKVDSKEAVQGIDQVEKGVKGIDSSAKGASTGLGSMTGAAKGLGLAFKAMGIGLVVSAFVALKDALGKNQEILDKFNVASAVFGDIMTKIGGIIVSVVQGIGFLGKALGKVLKGEFKEAGDIAKKALDGVKDSVVGNSESLSDYVKNIKNSAKDSAKFAKELVKLRNEVKLAEAQQRQLQLTYQKDAELQRQIRDDTSLTFEERIAANEELGRILDEQFAEEKKLADEKVRLAELELSRNKGNIDLQVALINAKTELADLDERITGQRSEQLTNLNALEKEQADAIKAAADAENKRLAEQKKAADEAEKIAKARAKAEAKIAKELALQKAQIAATAVGQIASLVGEDSKAGKALAISQALINTYLGAAKAIGQGGIFGVVAAAGVVAAGLKTVKDITSVKLPGVQDNVSPPDISSPSTGGTPDIQNLEQGPTGLGPLVGNLGALEEEGTQPIQAFVIENEISSSQALQEELEVQATL